MLTFCEGRQFTERFGSKNEREQYKFLNTYKAADQREGQVKFIFPAPINKGRAQGMKEKY